MRERMTRSRDPANRPPRADDRFVPKQQPATTGPGVALRKCARRRLRRSAGANAIVRAAPGRDDRRDSDVAEAI